ncbi:AMP-binding protein, partial [Saccharothrix xinjiangensis]|uniref:AMP-binding protein n=1 Tax=Saccharothrix xinjiangensis TaxID=204798 RepID=UPI0031CF1762
ITSVGGPTETTLWNIWHHIHQVKPEWRTIPYGTPIANTQYHILDEQLQQCPDWVTGHMYVSGIGLARGYHNNPEHTTKTFTTHPHTHQRLYHTGDLGRTHPHGHIDIIGRTDNQIKIHGHRIELGEIEHTLDQHPHIHTTIATTHPHPTQPNTHTITAYYLPTNPHNPPTTTQLRQHLTTTLPTHMIPTHLIPLHQIPLTPNGKINKNALPAPSG